ncbi:single-stranded-DNA-specific exonuclease RecJ [Methylovorus menthalis]|uniref:single-stranded-DNA-specific exonuclease RecJ n=1 Tax=Methylovorus menthalis TaxID=1002227 RepID=UPI001E518FEB|nr:single-stranded-DNA-specific exonuclease RecJ [Methylovorus menthalis]MCB4810565.1 single-stranded-DNA-specific exonuclease RecJ [Methylovorus menthalis]
MVNIVRRELDESAAATLVASGLSPLLAQLLAARGVKTPGQLEASLAGLIPPDRLTNNTRMAALLADAIVAKRSLLVVGDYDADGATATAVMVRGLRMLGAVVDFLVPNRFEYGYGLTPEIVELAAQSKPDFIITVDNGIASVDGVARANALGMSVLVTDHHLPGDHMPAAACIVNPNQHGCDFPSKHLAGVGVAFYVMLGLRAEMRARGLFEGKAEPNLTSLLDLVALGTVADLVKLDDNNRILVEQGLRRIRAGQCSPGILWLMRLAGREPASSCAQDLGFSVGPRLNAAGRLDDMTLGISCLLAEDDQSAHAMAQQLHALNYERRSIEADMQESALAELDGLDAEGRYSLSLYQPDWHQGVIGILASRIKERYHRPVIAFAQAGDGVLKGSGRSIPGLHLRDALDLVSKHEPDLILKFGGHAMAAGLSIREDDMERFRLGFESVVAGLLTPADLESIIEVDGALALDDMHWDVAVALQRQVWGQGFPPPMFCDEFEVVAQRIVGGKHLKLTLSTRGRAVDAIFFRQEEFLPQYVTAVYELQTNAFNGARNVQLLIKHWQPVPAQSN